jgi:hypothetical protein
MNIDFINELIKIAFPGWNTILNPRILGIAEIGIGIFGRCWS